MRRTFTIRLPFRRLILDAPSLDDIVPPHRALHHIKDAVHEQITLGRQLVSWYRREKVWWSLRDDRELLQQLYMDIGSGMISVREERIDDTRTRMPSRVHRWAADRFAWPTDPGPLDNGWTNTAKQARAEFRRRCDELLGTKLQQGVKQNPADWQAIFDLYDIAVARYLECESANLSSLRAALTFAEPPIVDCGEHWPVVNEDQDGVAERLNRRAEVVFFQPGELPEQHGGDEPPGHELYASGRYRQIRLTPVGSDEALLHITLLDEHGNPMPGANYSAGTRAGPWTGTSDGDGVATVPRALVETTVRLEWTAADDDQRRYWSYHALATDGETEQGLVQRLGNPRVSAIREKRPAPARHQFRPDATLGVTHVDVDWRPDWLRRGWRNGRVDIRPSGSYPIHGNKPSHVILHSIGTPDNRPVSNIGAAINTFVDNTDNGGIHYIVDVDGHFIKLCPETRAVAHSNESWWRDKSGLNRRSVGIEHAWSGKPDVHPRAQTRATVDLVRALKLKFGIDGRNIAGHGEVRCIGVDEALISSAVRTEPSRRTPEQRQRIEQLENSKREALQKANDKARSKNQMDKIKTDEEIERSVHVDKLTATMIKRVVAAYARGPV